MVAMRLKEGHITDVVEKANVEMVEEGQMNKLVSQDILTKSKKGGEKKNSLFEESSEKLNRRAI